MPFNEDDPIFDPRSRRILHLGNETSLSPKAASVLEALAETPGRVWSRDALLERIWPGAEVGDEVLTQAVAELRRALGDDFRKPRFVATVHKSGYRLLCGMQPDHPAAPSADTAGGEFDLSAYASYLQAHDLYERGGRSNMRAALSQFMQIIASYPRFALAHVGAAKTAAFLTSYYEAEEGLLDQALHHCDMAHKVAGSSAEAFAVQGVIFAMARKYDRSATCFGSSLMIDSNSGETHYLLGRANLSELDIGLAAVMFERAAKLRRDDYHSLLMAGKMREAAGEHELAKLNYGLALQRIEARIGLDEGDYRARCGRIRCLWQIGRTEEAHALMDAVLDSPRDPMNYYVACTLARAGRHEEALDVLEQVIELGWRHKSWLERDPDFTALHGHSKFKRLHACLA